MPRYIDADKAVKHLRVDSKAKYPVSYDFGLSAAANEIEKMPTADVVPRSEIYDDHNMQVTCYTLGCQEGDKIREQVARKIITEFKELAKSRLLDRGRYLLDRGLYRAAFTNALAYAEEELKKKYTEDKK